MTCRSHRSRGLGFVEETVTFWHEKNCVARESSEREREEGREGERKRNVDILNKTYYESEICSAIESHAPTAAKFRHVFFYHPCHVPIPCSRPRYRLPVIISPVFVIGFYN